MNIFNEIYFGRDQSISKPRRDPLYFTSVFLFVFITFEKLLFKYTTQVTVKQ
jgi:hypothetical protein